MEELEILISEEGEIKVQVKGIKGPGCRDVVKNFSSGVGKIAGMVNTSEFYVKPEIKTNLQNRGKKT